MSGKLLALEQLDEQLLPLKQAMPVVPRTGWVRTLRKALGLTVAQLAKKLGVVSSRVVKIESAELDGAVTLHTLYTVAEAMNCRMVYAFVPNDSLTHEITTKANKLAFEQLKRVEHTMQLEEQSVQKKQLTKHHEQLKNTILSKDWKHLWQD
jgi:predicted DNA-binding mobile mystery protein A